MIIVNVSESVSTKSGGVGPTVIQLSNSLANINNNKVYVISGNDGGDIVDNISGDVTHVSLNMLRCGKLSLFRGFFKLLDLIKPDCIIQHGIWGVFSAQITLYSRLRNVPYVVCPHGMLDPYILNRGKLTKYFASILYQNINIRKSLFLKALNDSEKSHCTIHSNVPVFIFPNGIDLSDYIPNNGNKCESTVLFLGRIDNKKGVFELIHAWLILAEMNALPPDSKLKIVGWPSDNSYYQECVKLAVNENSIEFIGPLFGPDKLNVYNCCGAFILPSKGEGLPTTVLEAWRSKSIVLMSEMCNFGTGVFSSRLAINSGFEVESIVEAISQYFKLSIDDKIDIRIRAYNFIKEVYDWDSIGLNFTKLLETEVKLFKNTLDT